MTAPLSHRKNKTGSALRATMRDVAALAGDVHPSTVSLALRNSPRVSVEMRSKVQAIAKQIGYRRDPLLDAFNRHRLKILPQRTSRVLAAISDFSSADELANSPLHAAARIGALEAAARLHCQLNFFFCGPGQPNPRRLDAVLDARGLHALLLFGVRGDSTVLEFNWKRNCTVAIDSLQLAAPFYRVTPDYREATRLLWRRAWIKGQQRIAILRSHETHPVVEDRAVAGFLLEQMRHPQADPIPVFTLTHERKSKGQLKHWFQTHRPQVILHSSTLTRSLGQLLGSETVHCQAFDASNAKDPGICPDYMEVGRRAVEQLVTLLHTNQVGPPPSTVCTYIAVNPA